MNNIKQTKLSRGQSIINRLEYQGQFTVGINKTQQHQKGVLKRIAQKRLKTEMLNQSQDKQTMEIKAKKELFEESQGYAQKQIVKSYPKMKLSNRNKRSLLQNDDQITAFAYDSMYDVKEAKNKKSFRKASQDINTQSKKRTEKIINHSQISQEVYWNKKKHHQIMILRPKILNPIITIQLNNDEVSLLNSPKYKINRGVKNFEAIIKEFARKTKEIYNSYEMSASKDNKQKRNRRYLSKRIARLRSKSTNTTDLQYRKKQFQHQTEKTSQKCQFDLQIKCFNTQKEQMYNKKQQIIRCNQHLKEKMRSLIVKQDKLSDKKYIKILLNGKITQNKGQSTSENVQKVDLDENKKPQNIHNRSKSSIVSNFKGPENKKLKIANILSKITKFKTQQLQNKRKKSIEQRHVNSNTNFQLIKCNIKLNENMQIYKTEANLLKINQQYSDTDAKVNLIKSIKSYCIDKFTNKLPFMINLMKKKSSIHPGTSTD